MEMPVVAGIIAVVLLVVLRHFAARRIAARQGRFVWLLFVPTLLGAGGILWASILLFASAPLVGALMGIAGAIYLAALVRFLTRLSRSVTSSRAEDDLSAAMTEPMVDYLETYIGLILIGALVAVVGLIVWGVSQAAR